MSIVYIVCVEILLAIIIGDYTYLRTEATCSDFVVMSASPQKVIPEYNTSAFGLICGKEHSHCEFQSTGQAQLSNLLTSCYCNAKNCNDRVSSGLYARKLCSYFEDGVPRFLRTFFCNISWLAGVVFWRWFGITQNSGWPLYFIV